MDTKTQMKNDTAPDLEAITSELATLRSELAAFAKHAVKAPAEAAAEVSDRLQASANDMMDKARSAGQATASSVEAQIEAHPVASIVLAFALGLVTSRLLARSDRPVAQGR